MKTEYMRVDYGVMQNDPSVFGGKLTVLLSGEDVRLLQDDPVEFAKQVCEQVMREGFHVTRRVDIDDTGQQGAVPQADGDPAVNLESIFDKVKRRGPPQ